MIPQPRQRKERQRKTCGGHRHTVTHFGGTRCAYKHAVQQITPDADQRQNHLPDKIAVSQLLNLGLDMMILLLVYHGQKK